MRLEFCKSFWTGKMLETIYLFLRRNGLKFSAKDVFKLGWDPSMLFKIERLVYVGQLWKHSWNKVNQRVYLPHFPPNPSTKNFSNPTPIFYQKLCQDTARSSTAKFKGCSAGKDTSKGGAAISPGRTNRKLSGLNPNPMKKTGCGLVDWFTRISESWWFGRWK